MEERTYSTVDKSAWPRGAWDHEPDKVQFATRVGLPGLIVRGPSGALCGYVGVTEPHPYFGVGYDDIPSPLDAHCGLTYSAACQPSENEATGICHVPADGESDHVWWFGFDCAHYCDLAPAYYGRHSLLFDDGEYRDIAYVRGHVESLASQLVEMA